MSLPKSESTESPFLTDAKVEKRPLNPSTMSPSDAIQSEPEPDSTQEPADKDSDEPVFTPQVPELNSDLLAIEANEKLDSSVAAQAATVPPPLGSASIAQQYTAQPSTGDQSHAAIYDASQYPEPVTHPAKKKSGWLWVLWVILLLGVGAGGAILLYNLGIIP